MHKQTLTFVLICGSSILMAKEKGRTLAGRQHGRALGIYRHSDAKTMRSGNNHAAQEVRGSMCRDYMVRCDVDRSRDILANEAEL